MQVPSDVRFAMFGRESSVLSVSHFESTEVSFESVGVMIDVRIPQVTKHVFMCVDNQAARAFEITEDTPVFRCESDLPTVPLFPVCELIDPAVTGRVIFPRKSGCVKKLGVPFSRSPADFDRPGSSDGVDGCRRSRRTQRSSVWLPFVL